MPSTTNIIKVEEGGALGKDMRSKTTIHSVVRIKVLPAIEDITCAFNLTLLNKQQLNIR